MMKKHFFSPPRPWCMALILAWTMLFPVMGQAFVPGSPILEIRGKRTFEAEIEESGPRGKVQETYSGISLTVPASLNDQSDLELKFGAQQIAYDWTDSEKITFSKGVEPWDELWTADMEISYMYHWNKNWSGLAGISMGAAWEDDMEDAYTYGGHFGAMYRADSNLSWIVGAAVFQGPEDTIFFPIIGARWRQEGLRGDPAGWSAILGAPKTEIRYSFNEILDAYCNVRMDMNTYRLKDDSEVSPSGLLEMTSFTSGLFLDIRPMDPLRISLGMTYLFGREWEIQDKDGCAVQNVDIDGVAAAGAALSWTF